MCWASCLASSVLPTPVGPTNRKFATGLSGERKPALERFTALTTDSTARVLAEDLGLERGFERGELVLLGHRDRAFGYPRYLGHDGLDLSAR